MMASALQMSDPRAFFNNWAVGETVLQSRLIPAVQSPEDHSKMYVQAHEHGDQKS